MLATIILVIGIVIFVLVLAVSWKVLPDMGFSGFLRGVMAFCIAALSVLGLNPMFIVQAQPSGLDVVLVPYTALGVSILFVLLFSILAACFRRLGLLPMSDDDEVDVDTEDNNSPDRDSERINLLDRK